MLETYKKVKIYVVLVTLFAFMNIYAVEGAKSPTIVVTKKPIPGVLIRKQLQLTPISAHSNAVIHQNEGQLEEGCPSPMPGSSDFEVLDKYSRTKGSPPKFYLPVSKDEGILEIQGDEDKLYTSFKGTDITMGPGVVTDITVCLTGPHQGDIFLGVINSSYDTLRVYRSTDGGGTWSIYRWAHTYGDWSIVDFSLSALPNKLAWFIQYDIGTSKSLLRMIFSNYDDSSYYTVTVDSIVGELYDMGPSVANDAIDYPSESWCYLTYSKKGDGYDIAFRAVDTLGGVYVDCFLDGAISSKTYWNPDIIYGESNKVMVTYEVFEDNLIRARFSPDLGSTWTGKMNVSYGSDDARPRIAGHQNYACVVMEDFNDGIAYNYSTDFGSSWAGSYIPVDSGDVTPAISASSYEGNYYIYYSQQGELARLGRMSFLGGGWSFGTIGDVYADILPHSHSYDICAEDSSIPIGVAWIDNRHGYPAAIFDAYSLPNLAPYTPPGWSDPIVCSVDPDTISEDTLTAGEPYYLSWAVKNVGPVDVTDTFYVCICKNDTPFVGWAVPSLPQDYYVYVVGFCDTISNQGFHTIKSKADFFDNIAESNETDNDSSRTHYWKVIPNWTFMVYIGGDNELGSYGDGDVDEMESAGSSADVNILVQIDGHPSSTYNDSSGAKSDANRYYIKQASSTNDTIDAYPAVALGEVNMADTHQVLNFFRWCVDNYPARRNAFVFWNHGSGWQKGGIGITKLVVSDETDGDYILFSDGKMRSILASMKSYIGRNIDILGFDVCLTCMLEVAYECRDYADYMIASEPIESGDGWDYPFLQDVVANPLMTPKELANKIVEYYGNFYATEPNRNLNSWDLGWDFTRLCSKVDKLAVECLKQGGMTNTTIQNVITNLQGLIDFDDPYRHYIDIRQLADSLNAENISAGINEACDSIITNFGYPPYQPGCPLCTTWCHSSLENIAHGITIMCPDDGTNLSGDLGSDYKGLLWHYNSAWYYFIRGDASVPDSIILVYETNSFDGGNGDSIPDPGEDLTMLVKLRNSGNHTAYNVWEKLSCQQSEVTITQDSIFFPTIPGDTAVVSCNSFAFSISSDCPIGRRITFELDIYGTTTAKANYSNKLSFGFDVGETKGSGLEPSSVGVQEDKDIPKICALRQSIPNPFSRLTNISYQLPAVIKVSLKIYDVTGRSVKTLVDKELPPGNHQTKWDAKEFASGVYFIRFTAGDLSATQKLILLRK